MENYEYKEGDIVKLIDWDNADIPIEYENKEGVLKYNEEDEELQIIFDWILESDRENPERGYLFHYEDIELVGWTYIPDYSLIKDEQYIITETDLDSSFINPLCVNGKYKTIIRLDIGGYYCSTGCSNSLSLQDRIDNNNNEFKPLNYKIEIRLDGTIKIFNKLKFDITIIDELSKIFYNYFEDCELEQVGDRQEWKFTIHFDKLIITNDYGNTHPILDLFVIFNLRVLDGRLIFKTGDYKLMGCRATLTEKEYFVKYSHSHLTTSSHQYINPYCLGEGPINTNISQFNMENDLLLFERIMLDIIDYVQVESLEGGPYIIFEKVYKPRTSSSINITDTQFKEEYIKFISNYDYTPFTIDNQLKAFVNPNNPKFIEQVSNITSFIKGGNQEIIVLAEDTNRILLKFKNEDIKLKVIKEQNEEHQDKEQQQRVADERVTKYIAEKLSKAITQQAIDRVTRTRTTGYFTGALVEDTSVTSKCGETGVVRSIVSKSGRKLAKL